MDYQSFLDAIDQTSAQDDERRRRRIAQLSASRKQAAADSARSAEQNKGLGDRIGDVLGFLGDTFVKPVTDAIDTTGKGLVHVYEDTTGVTAQRDAEFNKSQDEWQKMLLTQIAKSKDATLSQEERDKAKASAASIGRAMSQEFEGHQADLNKKIEEVDPMKQAGATVTLATTALGPGSRALGAGERLLTPAVGKIGGAIGRDTAGQAFNQVLKQGIGQSAKSRVAENIATNTAFGAGQNVAQTLADDGSNASGSDLAASAALGGLFSGAMTGGGALLKNPTVRKNLANRIDDFRTKPTSTAPTVDVNGNPVQRVSGETRPTDPTTPVTQPGEINPITGLRDNSLPTSEGIVTKGREQIMKDNKVQRSTFDKINESLFDANAPLNDFSREYKKRTGADLDIENDPHAIAQTINGMDEAAAARMQGLVGDMDYIRKNKLADAWKTYGIANQVVNDRAGIYAPTVVAAETKKLDDLRANLSPEQLNQVENAVQRTIEFQDNQLARLRDAGFISKEGYDAIKEVNPNYFTRFNFAQYIDDNQRLFASTNSKNISENIVRAVKGQGEDGKYTIEDPAEAITRAAIKTENLIQRNNVFHSIRNLQETLPDMVFQTRNADDVAQRMSLSLDNKELRPLRDDLDRYIKRDMRTTRKLETEINQLEKQGLNLALKGGGQRMDAGDLTVAGLGGDVPTSKAGQVKPGAMKDAVNEEIYQTQPELMFNEGSGRTLSEGGGTGIPSIHIDDLKQYGYNENIPNTYKRTTGKRDIDELAQNAGYDDVDNFMEDIMQELDTRKSGRENAKALADLRRDPKVLREANKNVETYPNKLGPSDTASVVRNLIENGSQKDIDRIKRKVGTRDQKLTDLLDDISSSKRQYDELADKVKSNSEEAQALFDKDVPEGYEEISGWRNGIKEKIAIPQYIADAYKGKNDAQIGAMERIMSAASRPFKAAATILSPAFLVKNSIRDTGTHWLTSKNISAAERLAILPYAKRWAQGFYDSITNSEFAQDVAKSGGGAAGIFNSASDVSRGAQKVVESTARELTGQTVDSPKSMFARAAEIMGKYSGFNKYSEVMQKAGRALEYAPRLAEARAAIENGAGDVQAALAARNALGDLQNGGTVSRLLNNYTPFFNSILQGNKRIVDSIREDPKKAMTMATAGIVLPTVSGYLWNRTMYPDVYQDIPEYEKENNFIIVLGDNKDEQGHYTDVIKIPKNDAAKVLGNNIEVAMAKMAGEDSQGFAELFMKTIGYAQPVQLEKDGGFSLDALVGSAPIASNPLVRMPFELATNHSLFTGRDIVPENLKGLNVEDQITDKTSPVDAGVAQFLDPIAGIVGADVAPQQVETARQGVSASLLNGKNPVDQVKNVVTGSTGSRGSQEFYTTRNEVNEIRKKASVAINKAIAANDIEAAQRIAARYNQIYKEKFTPWIKNYGADGTDEMRESFKSLKLDLSSRSIKQRRKNINEKNNSK